jgi:LPXTG-site transpeptidase (sortase) family protein
MSRTGRWSLLLLLLAWCVPVGTTRANTAAGVPVRFAETGHTLAYAFREYFEARGGLALYGYPITEVFVENGRPVQYFERARMEWHAQLALVQLGHLGRWAAGRQSHAALAPVDPPNDAAEQIDFFRETGHTLRGEFRAYWYERGGLPVFGFPLSEPFMERNAQDDQEYLVQYFERARFEYHPELPPLYRVSLGHLGRQYLAEHAPPAWALEPVADKGAAWAAVRPSRVVVPRLGVDTDVSSQGFSLGQWDVPRYTAAHYWPLASYPGTGGNIIIAGHVGYKDTIFNKLPNIRAGDEIVVYVNSHSHRYVTREILTLLPKDTWVMLPTRSETLTLITCVPIGTYTHRLIVRAEPLR